MRRNLIGVLVVLVIAGAFLAVRLGGRHAARSALEESLANLPPGYTATHGATDYDAITDTLTVHDFVLNHDGVKVASAGTAVVSGAHPQALQDVFDPAAYPNGKPAWTDRRPLLGHVDMTGLAFYPPAPGTVPVKLRHVALDGLSGRPFIRPPSVANRSAIDFETDVAQALAVKSLTAEDLDIADPGQGHITIAAETLSGYDGGKLDAFAITSIDVSSTASHPTVSLSLAKFAIGGVDARASLATLAGAGAVDPMVRRRVALQAYAGLQARSGDIDGFAMKITPGPRFDLASEHGESSLGADGIREGHGSVHGLTMAAGDMVLSPAAHLMIERFGTDRLSLDIDGAGRADDAKGRAELQQFDMVFHDLGTLHMTAKVDGYDRIAMRSGDQKVQAAAAMKLIIDQASLEWDDASLTNRLINLAALQQNTTPDQVKAAAAMPLAGLAMMLPDQPDAGAQVTAFLNNPHQLRITLDPPSPMKLSEIAALPVPERAHALGVRIKAD